MSPSTSASGPERRLENPNGIHPAVVVDIAHMGILRGNKRTDYLLLPDFLAELREKAGFSQRQLAAKMERTQSWVFKSERGLRRIDVAEFVRWCMACGIEPAEAIALYARSLPPDGSKGGARVKRSQRT